MKHRLFARRETTSRSLLVAICTVAGAGVAFGQAGPPSGPTMRGDGPPPAAKPFNITRSDPALELAAWRSGVAWPGWTGCASRSNRGATRVYGIMR